MRKWLQFIRWPDRCHRDTRNQTDCGGHASLSAVSHVCSCTPVRVRRCFPLAGVVGARRGMLQQPHLPSLTRLREGGRPNYTIHRAPNSPRSPQLTFINYSLLFFFRNSFLEFHPGPGCAHGLCRNKLWRSLFPRTECG